MVAVIHRPDCSVAGCSRKYYARDLCGTHYHRWLTKGEVNPDVPISIYQRQGNVCSVGGCDRPPKEWGMCGRHYSRERRYGDASAPRPLDMPREARFWAQVQKTECCWFWRGHINNRGYGKFGRDFAHRFAYIVSGGTIAEGLEIDHLCRRPNCVRPDHLEPVTRSENLRRMRAHRHGECCTDLVVAS